MDILQIALTPVVLTACVLVLWQYLPLVLKNGQPTTYSQWLMLGVVLAFSAKICDQLYSSLFVVNNELFCRYGAAASIVLRQLPSLLAGVCHIRAMHMFMREKSAPFALRTIVTLTIVTALFLIGTKIVRGL